MKDIGVCIYISYDSIETARVLGLLEAEGIPAYTKEEGAGELFRLYSGHSYLPTRIYVPDCEEEHARLLLKDIEG